MSTDDILLAAGLHGGLTDKQVEGALAYLELKPPLSLSRLDDICLDLHMEPDEHGNVRAPAWLYAGVMQNLIRNGLIREGTILTDETLTSSVTRVWQRHDAQIAAREAKIQGIRGQVFEIQQKKANEYKKTFERARNQYIEEATIKILT